MTRLLRRAGFALLLASACGTARALADEYTDYRIPSHRTRLWTGTSQMIADRRTFDQPLGRTKGSEWEGLAQTGAQWFSTGDDRTTNLTGNLSLLGGQASSRRVWTDALSGGPSVERSTASDGRLSRQLSLVLSHSEQLAGSAFYVSGATSIEARWLRNWDSGEDSLTYQLAPDEHYASHGLHDSRSRRIQSWVRSDLEAGIGRMRDATGVYLARLVEARLRQAGALVRPLSNPARQRLIDLITMANSYDRIRTRSGRPLWTEIARIAAEDGALAGGGLDAASAERAGESMLAALGTARRADGLPSALRSRWRGARIGVQLSDLHDRESVTNRAHSSGRLWQNGVLVNEQVQAFDSRSIETNDVQYSGAVATWRQPLGDRWQLDADVRGSVPLRGVGEGFWGVGGVTGTWMVADRWFVEGRAQFIRQWLLDDRGEATRFDRWDAMQALTVYYEIDDRLLLRTDLAQQQSGDHDWTSVGANGARGFQRRQQLFVGMSYRFTGRFLAPGFPTLSEHTPVSPAL